MVFIQFAIKESEKPLRFKLRRQSLFKSATFWFDRLYSSSTRSFICDKNHWSILVNSYIVLSINSVQYNKFLLIFLFIPVKQHGWQAFFLISSSETSIWVPLLSDLLKWISKNPGYLFAFLSGFGHWITFPCHSKIWPSGFPFFVSPTGFKIVSNLSLYDSWSYGFNIFPTWFSSLYIKFVFL